MMNHSGEKAFACEECKREFAFKTISNGIVHARVKPIFSRQCDEIITNPYLFGVCSCTRVKNHLYVKFVTWKLLVLSAERWSKNETNLNSYMRIHVGEKPFVCDNCDKYKSILIRRMFMHTDEKTICMWNLWRKRRLSFDFHLSSTF